MLPGPCKAPNCACRLSIVSAAHQCVRSRDLNVAVAVRGADRGALRVALVVAQHHAEPEGDTGLEGPHRAGEAAIRLAGRLDRQLDLIALAATRAGPAGEELGGGLIVADVMAVVLEAVLAVGRDLRTDHAAPHRLLDRAEAVAVQ